MATFETVIHDGTVVSPFGTYKADVGINDGRVVAIAEKLSHGDRRIDAGGRLVVPGGIEAHCHIAQESSSGIMTSDDYYSGSVSAAFGGNSCFIPFAAQHRGQSIAEVISTYDGRASPNSVIDYSYHLIISDPSPSVLDELPAMVERGITSFKVFMTYDLMNIGDGGMLDILTAAKANGAVTMVHAENNEMVKWMNRRFRAAGLTEAKFHPLSRPEIAEEEAINRAIALAKLVDTPLFIVHVSTRGGAEIIQREKLAGAKIYAETCPQYLALTRSDLDRPGNEGAKYVCSPPLRDAETQASLWRHIQLETFESVSSDHAPYRADATGKFVKGFDAPYPDIANGMPGIAMRLPYLFSEGVLQGRISLPEFVRLSSSNAARVFGLDRKGVINPGFDADIAIWNPEETRVVSLKDQHDNMDYTPFDGMEITGWPETVLNRGRLIIEQGRFVGLRGDGKFIHRKTTDMRERTGYRAVEFDIAASYGHEVAP